MKVLANDRLTVSTLYSGEVAVRIDNLTDHDSWNLYMTPEQTRALIRELERAASRLEISARG